MHHSDARACRICNCLGGIASRPALLGGIATISIIVTAFVSIGIPVANKLAAIQRIECAGGVVLVNYDGPAWIVGIFGDAATRALGTVDAVSLARTEHVDELMTSVQRLVTVRHLCLRESGITASGLRSLRALKCLEDLDLVDVHITRSGLTQLKHMQSLRILNLGATATDDINLPEIAAIPRLEHVNLNTTHVTSNGITWLNRERPDLHIGK